MARDFVAAQTETIKLRCQLARYRRAEFVRASEWPAPDADQLELAIEILKADQAGWLSAASALAAAIIGAAADVDLSGAACRSGK
jgi:hypothetical protein